MALILKSGKTYKDKTSATSSSAYYGKIVDKKDDTLNKSMAIEFAIFKNKAARDAGASPCEAYRHVCSGDDYETYFGVDVLNASGVNDKMKGYEFLLEKVYDDRIVDEDSVLKYADWVTDEA